jgi:hypothetical protein
MSATSLDWEPVEWPIWFNAGRAPTAASSTRNGILED